TNYVFFGYGAGSPKQVSSTDNPAVTISVAKRPGANATELTKLINSKVELVRSSFIPANVNISVTRDYGQTAKEKSDELLMHMLMAVVGVTLLIYLFLGWKGALVVAVAIPTTLAL
ncbi:efflux RND transporter permease subunit, partial [Arthrospira platensis SPKY1]|nr:efflux RND transporter permease subunit [Arthrospira platensis SPKY1]